MKTAPILLFTYIRLDTLVKTVNALKQNMLAKDSDLYIFSDGEKKEGDKKKVNQIRIYLKSIDGFKSITISESSTNKGLANSIISGVSEIMTFSDRVIVLEDDLITTPNFLTFMNSSLDEYQNKSKVFSISGFSFDFGMESKSQEETYFLYRGWPWGWAIWKDRWTDIDWDVSDYDTFEKDKKLKKKFSQLGSDVNNMLKRQMEGSLDSWAIRWSYHQFKVNGITLFPLYSKVYNDGWDDHATHTKGSNKRYFPRLDTKQSINIRFPKKVEVKDEYQNMFLKKMGINARIRSKIETLFTKYFAEK
jgi:hypothetical protein